MSYHGEALYDFTEELFLPIHNYVGYYISDTGHLLHNGRILTPRKGDREGHLAISFYNPGTKKREYEYVYRMVMHAFCPYGYSDKVIVRHLDDDPANNCIDILAYGTQKDNHVDAVRNRKYKPFSDADREKAYQKARKKIMAINVATKETTTYSSENEASRSSKIPQANIYKVLYGERKQAGGFIFSFVKEVNQHD